MNLFLIILATIIVLIISVGIYIMIYKLSESFEQQHVKVYTEIEGSTCSKECCLQNPSGFSCASGCVCQSERNSEMISNRGGNKI